MRLIEEQIKLGLYDKYHDLDVISSDLQYINSSWYVDNNILIINIEAHNTDDFFRQGFKFKIKVKSIEQVNKIISKFEDFIKELK
jgi:hypothetical protein